ncbi:MAG: marine proteobacterial sortase target protein [Erythrobacter sp.]|nr:marine proteobacterial sortase target protein [Erythrobacter sp.]
MELRSKGAAPAFKSFAVLLLLVAAPAGQPLHAQAVPDDDPFASGGLVLRGGGVSTEMPAMRLGTDIRAEVSGSIARVTVTQAFRNTSDQWMEATYLYPLPDNGAVDDLRMVVGDRILIGNIREREEARQIYETALVEGRRAGLVEQERPNMFRTNAANVGPGETVLVAIQFQAPVRQLGDEYALRLPLVVGPRYVPPHTLMPPPLNHDTGIRLERYGLAAFHDAQRLLAPVMHPDMAEGLNPVSITVDLDPGFVPEAIDSPYHPIRVTEQGNGVREVQLASGPVPANRDFELRWRAGGSEPAVALYRQRLQGMDYLMATITPPPAPASSSTPPREMVFVIDNSGSMGGDSMDAARSSLLYALDRLQPGDRFNVIRFDDTMTELFPQPVAVTPAQVAVARAFAENIDASGGTEMLPALREALVDDTPDDRGRVRQVIFLTDGGLSNEEEMMAEIVAHRGRSRVFMVGMGSAPNGYLMRRMAEAGRGTFTNVGMGFEVRDRMRELLLRLATPVATGLRIETSGTALEFTPQDLPDLYAGEPLVLLGRTANSSGTVTLSGVTAGRRWTRRLYLGQAASSDAVARLWARRRIDDIEAQRWSYQIDYDEAAQQIAALGLAFHIVTSETSLIAEDQTPARPAGAHLVREELPLLLPAGWDFDALFGRNAELAAAYAAAAADDPDAVDLPQTAAPWRGALATGLLVLLAGLTGLVLARRRGGGARQSVVA